MALASRLLSRSTRQLCAGQVVLRPKHAVPVRSFAKEAAAPTTLKGDQVLKDIFYEVKNKLETAIGVLRKEKITIEPEDPAAVTEANLLSESEIIKFNIEVETHEIPDARTYLLKLKEMRVNNGLGARKRLCASISLACFLNLPVIIALLTLLHSPFFFIYYLVRRGLIDSQGIEDLQMAALDKVEKELKKPLLRNDKKGIALLTAEFDKINQKLGIRKEELPKYEEQLELKIAKAQLEELKKDALEAMETQKKREEFKDEEMPTVKSLDIRNFI
ncbi:hypothetical protein H5410_023729 [Solanum commersonii]|nr:hypothetical protein H5410_023729 [Solanum commersonii]